MVTHWIKHRYIVAPIGQGNVINFGEYRLMRNLDSSTRDEEPLVNAAVNGSRGKVLALGNAGKLGLVSTVRGTLDGGVGTISN